MNSVEDLLSNKSLIPGLMRVEARTELAILLEACTEDVGILRPGAERREVAPHTLLGTGRDSITILGAGLAGDGGLWRSS